MTDEHQSNDADDVVDPDVPSGNESGAEGGKVLTPEELDISESEYVEELDDQGRYVVSPGGGPPNASKSRPESGSADRDERAAGADAAQPATDPASQGSPGDQPVSPEAARSLLAEELGRTNAKYGLDVVARFEGEPLRHRTVSNDVVATFENLVLWYARHVADETPADEVIEILLRESTFDTPKTTPNLKQLLEKYDLAKTDSIQLLVNAISTEADRNR
jgi:hypothetical protein